MNFNKNIHLYEACVEKNYALVSSLLLEKDIDVNFGLQGACKGGHMDLVQLMIDKGANNWNEGLLASCLGGHKDLAQFMIDKGANDFNRGLHRACIGGHEHMVQMMIDNGAHEWEWGLEGACEGGHTCIAKIIIKRGARLVNLGLLQSIHHRHRNLALLMIYYGADDWLCVLGMHDDKFILQTLRCLKSLENVLRGAKITRLQDFVSFIKPRLVGKRKCYLVNRHGVKAKDIFFHGIDNVDRQHNSMHNITEQFTYADVANFMTRFVGLYPFNT